MKKLRRLIRYEYPLYFVLLFTNWLPNNVAIIKFRGFLARPFFKKCGKGLQIQRNVTFYNPAQIIIGNDVIIPYGCWINASGPDSIILEDNVGLGPYVVLVSGGYDVSKNSRVPVCGKILIQKGAWIGANSTVLKDVIVGENSVIAANSLVDKNVPKNIIFAGSPGKKICRIV